MPWTITFREMTSIRPFWSTFVPPFERPIPTVRGTSQMDCEPASPRKKSLRRRTLIPGFWIKSRNSCCSNNDCWLKPVHALGRQRVSLPRYWTCCSMVRTNLHCSRMQSVWGFRINDWPNYSTRRPRPCGRFETSICLPTTSRIQGSIPAPPNSKP